MPVDIHECQRIRLKFHRVVYCRNSYDTLAGQLGSVCNSSLYRFPIQRWVTVQNLVGRETGSKIVKYRGVNI